MISIQQVIYSTLTSDSALMNLLSGGIHSIWVKEGSYPRLIFTMGKSRINNEINGGNLTLDIYVDGNNTVLAENIGARIEYLIEKDFMTSDETGPTLRAFFIDSGIVPDEDPEIIHKSIIYDLRSARISPALLV